MSVSPLQFLLLVFAGWVNRHQADVLAYLQEENRVLRERLDGRRLHLTDAQRCFFIDPSSEPTRLSGDSDRVIPASLMGHS